jgi:hypothetical protein
LPCLHRARYRALHHSEGIPSHDVAGSFQFCEPKIEVEIVGPSHLSRAKKFQKKIQKNETDPSDD